MINWQAFHWLGVDKDGGIKIVWKSPNGSMMVRGWFDGPTGWFCIEGKASS